MLEKNNRLIVALDVATLQEAETLVTMLSPRVTMFKVGSQLFTACGPEAVKMIIKKGGHVFLDLKFHDIPNTVFQGVASGTNLNAELIRVARSSGETAQIKETTALGVFMMTIHTAGGESMLKKAVEGAASKAQALGIPKPFLVGVTVLTSDSNGVDTGRIVLERAYLAREAGLDGVVCSPLEAGLIREKLGKGFIIVTPGIRGKEGPSDDQKRTATVAEAIAAGSDFLVVGRPIVKAKEPLRIAEEFLKEIECGV